MTLFFLCTVNVINSVHFCEKKLGFMDLIFVKPLDKHVIFLDFDFQVELNSRKICVEVYWYSITTLFVCFKG